MDLLELTNYDQVRSALGVNDKELQDETLGLELFSTGLLMDMDEVSFNVYPKYIEVEAKEATTRSAAEQRFYLVARTFATYSVAKQCSTSLPLFSPKEVSDSKTLIGRFAASPYKDTIEQVATQFVVWRDRLIAAFNAADDNVAVATTRIFMLTSGVVPDPVTGS